MKSIWGAFLPSGADKKDLGALRSILFVKIHPFHPFGDAGENFIGNGFQRIGKPGNRIVVAEDDHLIPFPGIGSGDVKHGHIHAYVADDGHRGSVHEEAAIPVA